MTNSIFNTIPESLRDRVCIVGGFVRDILLDKEPNDIDFVVENSSIEEMLSLGFKLVGKDFPVFLDKEGREFALCRQERKNGVGYKGFTCVTENISFKDDLSRRDLTINAMLINSKLEVIDPFNGYQDLEDKVLRHVSPAFAEDPLRVLRVARFTSKYPEFKIHEETINLCKSLKEELQFLTKERIFKELEKVLETKKPSNFFRSLDLMDCLDILFPELYEMKFLEHNPLHHAEGNVFEHTMCVLDLATTYTNKKESLFAALFHDIGKTKTYNPEKRSFHGHEELELNLELFALIKERYCVPNKYIDFALKVAVNHHRIHGLRKMTFKGLYRLINSPYFPKNEEELQEFYLIIKADATGRLIPLLSDNESDKKNLVRYLPSDLVKALFRNSKTLNRPGIFYKTVLYVRPDFKNEYDFLNELLKIRSTTIKMDFTGLTVENIKSKILNAKYHLIRNAMKRD